jgi:FkbM family methyltransferase
MSAIQGFETYYHLFGFRGLLLAAKARCRRSTCEIAVPVPGIEHPVYLRLRTTDVSVFRQVLVTKEYDSPFFSTPKTIIDAGANIGLTSVFYANKYPGARIIAIEPESSNFRMLQRNTAAYSNVTALQAALWKENCEISLVDPSSRKDGFRTVENDNFASKSDGRVRAMTLDRIMADFNIERIDILKLDIEGSEKEVFEHSAPWIGSVGTIIIEFHDQFRTGCARSVYTAAKEFHFEWRKGETVYLTRDALVR